MDTLLEVHACLMSSMSLTSALMASGQMHMTLLTDLSMVLRRFLGPGLPPGDALAAPGCGCSNNRTVSTRGGKQEEEGQAEARCVYLTNSAGAELALRHPARDQTKAQPGSNMA